MGYRSEVAYAIVFKDKDDRDKILNKLSNDDQVTIQEDALIEEDRILYHEQYIKWYTTRAMNEVGLTGFAEVDAHDKLIQTARDESDLHHETDGKEGVYSLGVFMRLGEEDDDVERDRWGDYNPPENFPEWWELVDYSRRLTIGWEN